MVVVKSCEGDSYELSALTWYGAPQPKLSAKSVPGEHDAVALKSELDALLLKKSVIQPSMSFPRVSEASGIESHTPSDGLNLLIPKFQCFRFLLRTQPQSATRSESQMTPNYFFARMRTHARLPIQ